MLPACDAESRLARRTDEFGHHAVDRRLVVVWFADGPHWVRSGTLVSVLGLSPKTNDAIHPPAGSGMLRALRN
jgi:hypothetical protein